MRYMMLIYSDPQAYQGISETEQSEIAQEYQRVTQEMGARGVRESGEPLQPTHTATTVRIRNGKTTTIDGPFAETQEQLVGYYLILCRDLDEALEYAAKIPDSRYGSVEIRPVREIQVPTTVT